MSLVNAEPRTLGAFSVGPISHGLWRYTNDDLASAQELIETALDWGMNPIDTSDVYGFDRGVALGVALDRSDVYAIVQASEGVPLR